MVKENFGSYSFAVKINGGTGVVTTDKTNVHEGHRHIQRNKPVL